LREVPLEAANLVDQDVGRNLSSVQREHSEDEEEDGRLNSDRLQLINKKRWK